MTPHRQSRMLAARALPIPECVSTVLAAAMAEPLQEREALLLRAPTTPEGWELYLREMNAFDVERLATLRASFSVDIVERQIEGVAVRWVRAHGSQRSERLLVHIHGGAYVAGAGEIGCSEAVMMASRTGMPVVSIDYRMPPAHPFPAAVDDCLKVWAALSRKRAAASMAIFGTSTGGALALSAAIAARDAGLPLPGAIAASTPWSDLSETGDSYAINRGVDCAVPFYDGLLAEAARLYAGAHSLRHPLISPVYADLKDLPPVILTTGTRDLFLSCTVRMHRALRDAGVPADLHVFEGVSHGQLNGLPDSAESIAASREIDAFFQRHLIADTTASNLDEAAWA